MKNYLLTLAAVGLLQVSCGSQISKSKRISSGSAAEADKVSVAENGKKNSGNKGSAITGNNGLELEQEKNKATNHVYIVSVFQANSYPQPLKGLILFNFQRADYKNFATVAADRY